MKTLMLVLLLVFTGLLSAGVVRIYFCVDVDSDPSEAELSLKTGPLVEWDYMGKTPCRLTLYRDLDITAFLRSRDYVAGQTVYYSDRYGYSKIWIDPGQLFNTLKRDFGDAIIADLGVFSTGALMVSQPGYEDAVRNLEINGNITNLSFDQSQAQSRPNSFRLAQREAYPNYGRGFPREKTIRVSSDPSNSAIYCNEEYMGQSPCDITVSWRTAKDRIEVRFEKSGYITNRRMITPEEERIHVVLQPMW